MSNLIGKAYNPYGMASNGNGLISGYEYGRNLAKQRGLASGFSKIQAGDESGWKEAFEADPQATMNAWNTQKKLEQLKTGGSWTSDAGRWWSIAHDPNSSPEDKRIALGKLQYDARLPEANQSWSQAGRIGQLQGDLALAGQVEAEKKKATQSVEREMDEEQLKRQVPVAMQRINDLRDGLKKDDSGIGPIAGKTPWTTKSGYDNRANVRNAQAQINTAMRGLLKSMGVGSTELNSAVEAEAYRYMINQEMPRGQILKVLDNFEKDFISGRLEKDLRASGYGKTNNGKNKNSKYIIEEVIE